MRMRREGGQRMMTSGGYTECAYNYGSTRVYFGIERVQA